LYDLFRQYELRKQDNFGMARLLSDLALYDDLLKSRGGKSIDQSCVLELGYGARPFRAVGMAARGARMFGLDLEQPVLGFDRADYVEIARRNGIERALKSFARSVIFDNKEVRAFEAAVQADFFEAAKRVSFLIGDASEHAAWSGVPDRLDLVYSEDVFEHIPRDNISRLLELVARHVTPQGVVLIRPNIWTGITGGHFVDWYHSNVDRSFRKRRPPWHHLVSGAGEPSVYLNKLRYNDYVELFSKEFEIIDVSNSEFGLGRRYLTEDVRSRIPAFYSDEDLLTNNVLFVLRRKR